MEEKMETYAIIQAGGQQFRVEVGDVIDVDLLCAEEQEVVTFDRVLFLGMGEKVAVGVPTVSAAKVTGEIVEHVRGPKVVNYKYKCNNYRRKVGHRQDYTRVKITGVEYGT